MVRWLVAVAFLLSGCSEDRTEIIVVVDSNLSVPDQLDEIRIQVTGPDGTTKNAGATLGPGEEPLPRTLGLVHEEGPLSPVRILVTGRSGGSDVIERRANLGFVKGETLVLRMDLLASCVAVRCGPEETCLSGSCVSAAVDPETLPEWNGEVPRLDASMPPADGGGGVDAGPQPDAGRDAGDCRPRDEMCNGLDDDCDGAVDEAFDLMTDPNHCGECGNRCAPPDRTCCEGTCGRC